MGAYTRLKMAADVGAGINLSSAEVDELAELITEHDGIECIKHEALVRIIAKEAKEVYWIGVRYRNALKFYGNPNNWRFTHDKQGNLLWVCSMGPDYALEVLDDDELNALKPHIGLRGIKELEEPQESESQCMVGGHPPDCKGHI
jgi:hypothetical protein